MALAFLGAVLPSAHAGRGTHAKSKIVVDSLPVHRVFAESGPAGAALTNSCRPVSTSTDYLNPLASAHLTPERIDQGVDYAGSGTLTALGDGTVSYVGSNDTLDGWPGSFIEYRLLDGPDAGCYVYYAEGVRPAAGLHVGEFVAAGVPVATIIPGWPTGIEIGWGSGTSTGTYAAKMHEWNPTKDADNIPSAAGKNFSALIESLGGPAGKDEG